jgi:hypothetical protein
MSEGIVQVLFVPEQDGLAGAVLGMVQNMVRSGMAVEQVAMVTGMAIEVVTGYLDS